MKKIKKKSQRLVAIVLTAAFPFSSCSLLPPAPTNEQILQAVMASNAAETEPPDLVYEEMEVPHRMPGNAHALLWIPDYSIQRNFTVLYDRKEKAFFVESYITLVRGEDGNSREVE